MHDLAQQILSQLKSAWRYRWYGVGLAWVIALGGWVAVFLMPPRYEAFAQVHVDTETMLKPLLSGLAVQPNIEQMVTILSRTIVSRPNLEKVVQMAERDSTTRTREDRERLIARLAEDLTVNAGRVRNMYYISYTDSDPDEAKRIVESLLKIFVESSIGGKRKDSDEARRFIDEQLKTLSDRLVAAESAVTEFKRRHLGLTPGEGRDYYGRLVDLQTTLSQSMLELKEAENARDSIKAKLAEKYGGENANPELISRIQALEQKLDALRLTYTEQHPDIVALRRTLSQLKSQQEAEARSGKRSTGATESKDPVYQQLAVSVAAAEAKVASINARVAEYRKREKQLRALADAAPQVEAEYKQLTRDYEVTKSRYTNMLARRAQAEVSGDMAADARMIDFRVIEPPQVRRSPKAPGRLLLVSLVLLGALGGGAGLAFLISQGRPTFGDERRLKEVSGLQVLGSVPLSLTDAAKRRRLRGLIAFLISIASLLSAYAAVMAGLMLTVSRI